MEMKVALDEKKKTEKDRIVCTNRDVGVSLKNIVFFNYISMLVQFTLFIM